jgi:hypothetical protein
LAAAIIASLAVQAGVEAIMGVARGIKETALAAADAASSLLWRGYTRQQSRSFRFSGGLESSPAELRRLALA